MLSIEENMNYFSVWERENTLCSNKIFWGSGTRENIKGTTQQCAPNEFRRQ